MQFNSIFTTGDLLYAAFWGRKGFVWAGQWGAKTLSMKTFSIVTLSKKGLFATFSISTLGKTTLCHYAECHYTECCVLFIVKLNVIMPSVL